MMPAIAETSTVSLLCFDQLKTNAFMRTPYIYTCKSFHKSYIGALTTTNKLCVDGYRCSDALASIILKQSQNFLIGLL